MSGNLMASLPLSSHAPVGREPHAAQSDARGPGAGFESLLAEFDPPNASTWPAQGERGSSPPAARAASSPDPSALTPSRAAHMTNIDAALSSLTRSASAEPVSRAAAKTAATVARVAPSSDAGTPAAAPTNLAAALSSSATEAFPAPAPVGRNAPAADAAAARRAPSGDPGALTRSRAAVTSNIAAALSSLAMDASPAAAPEAPAPVSGKSVTPAAHSTPSRDFSAPPTSPATNLAAIATSLASEASPAPEPAAPIAVVKATAARPAPPADPRAPTKSHAASAANIVGAASAAARDPAPAPTSAASIPVVETAPAAARPAPSAHPHAPTKSRAEPATKIDATQSLPSSLAKGASLAPPPPGPAAAAKAAPAVAQPVARSAAPVDAAVKASTAPAGLAADTNRTLAPAPALSVATSEAAPVATTANAAPTTGFVRGSPISTTADAAVAPWPSGSKANPSVLDAGSFLSAQIARVGAATPDASTTLTPAGGGGGLQTEPAPAPKSVTPAPGAAAGSISYATQIALSFAPEVGFQGLQTKTHLAVPSAESAAGVGVRGSAPGNATASALFPPSVAPIAQGNPRDEKPTSSNPSRNDPGAAAPQADSAKAPEATPTLLAAVSMSPAAPSSTDANAVNLSDLGQRLADEARSLVEPDGKANAKLATLPIKELHLDLHPANLGAVAIRLKMTDGKLSVEVGVDNPNALAAVEGQRDTMIAKLQSGTQPLASFVVHQQAFADPFSMQTSSNPSLTGSSGNTSGHDQTSRDAREQTPRQPRTAPADDAPPPRNGVRPDLVV